ncbi:MAG: DUF488 domain-containing protein [Candidatus Cloacimonetes bacterium]|nr:DUF488 domain-containing protein [Candidatus Cloacimonadota bacterium]MCF7814911.1 DUF488 domain-containing protein [Candidatus Cloacimonadota bacterium]MCF7868093.1 DUF488 domain-containing protein [Candidatus Cloacimonadota bacterium]MCF7883559.1 DUF488 domain-containing protein [Candidatus Cloacimonadota bacterium]
MYYRRKVLLALIEKSKEKKIGKLNLQKMLFLFCRKQHKPSYDFIPYNYGCYSFQANKDLLLMSQFYNLIGENETEWILKTNDSYINELNSYDSQNISNLFKTEDIDNQSKFISSIYKRYPYYAINSKRNLNSNEQKLINHEKQKVKSQNNMQLFTIGYEGKNIDQYLDDLIRNNITVLCDVRRNPKSMKYGFSKKQIQRYCNNLSIKYVHLPELGIESSQRKNLSDKESYRKLFDLYKIRLNSKAEEIKHIYDLLEENKRIALTCFESDPLSCHRHIIANKINKEFNIPINHI